MVKITDQNSEIYSGTIDMSQTHNKINRFVSADNLVNPESYKNSTSTDPNFTVPSVISHSEKVVVRNTEPSKVRDKLGNAIKQVLVIDDDFDSAITIRTCIESYFKKDSQGSEFQVMEVTMYSNPITALVEFKPYYYDLLLVDINMPTVNGYE